MESTISRSARTGMSEARLDGRRSAPIGGIKEFTPAVRRYFPIPGPQRRGRYGKSVITLTTDPRTGKPVPETHDLTYHFTKGHRLVRTSGRV